MIRLFAITVVSLVALATAVIGAQPEHQPGTVRGVAAPQAVAGGNRSKPPPTSYAPVIATEEFEPILARDQLNRATLNGRQETLLNERYDLSNLPSRSTMSGNRKAVQEGVRVKLPEGLTWEALSTYSADAIREQGLFPQGFRPLPHSLHTTGGMVFPKSQIDAILKAEHRDIARIDTDFDLPDHLTPEFPPPMFLTTRPELGDVARGEVVTIKNYFRLFNGILTPVQLEGLRLLLTPFPQQQFNATDDRKVATPQLGVTCFDCHVNGHTNGAFHLNPDTRPQSHRFRIETISLRGIFNQQIHGSKRSLRSVEDFTEFEQRTAYFDGDHVLAAKKGVHLPERSSQVAMMAQMQSILDFSPAVKLDLFGRLSADLATEQELRGEKLFQGKGRCAACHPAPFYLDHQMHDLRLHRFYTASEHNGLRDIPEGPIKTFTLRGIKDSPPYLHDGRLLTLEDSVEFFNLVLQIQLTKQEKADLVAFLRCL